MLEPLRISLSAQGYKEGKVAKGVREMTILLPSHIDQGYGNRMYIQMCWGWKIERVKLKTCMLSQ